MIRSRFSLLPLLTAITLVGCSSHSQHPDFSASGYLADRGSVRIWRKEHDSQISRLMTVYTPFNGPTAETTDYQWQQGRLVAIERHTAGEHPESVTMRFDQDGSLSFMQRQLENRREALSADAIALYQYDAGRMLAISDDLLKGRVVLQQGHWMPSGTVTLCKKGIRYPVFDRYAMSYITQHQQESGKPLSIAWLEAPGGTQLLLVSADDLCPAQPTAEDF